MQNLLIKNNPLLEKTPLSALNQLYEELFFGGKGLRARLIQDISQCIDLKEADVRLLCGVVESIHHSSILHDDVLDSSRKRRGRLAAWVQFSKSKAILAGDYLLAHVSLKLSEYGNAELLRLTSHTIKKMVEGEWLQSEIKGKETCQNVSQVHLLKTAVLFEWCLRAPFLCKGHEDLKLQNLLKEIGQTFGILFQRADDLLDFGFRNKENKSEFKDLSEGYLNFVGAYLKEKIHLKNDKAFRARRNYSDLEKIIGKDELKKHINQFDKINQPLIDDCLPLIKKVSSLLNQNNLAVVLKNWINKLYFR